MTDSNDSAHYIIFDKNAEKTFAIKAAPVIDTIYIRDDASWGKANIKLYTYSDSTYNSPAKVGAP